jgi:hypothetical protein
MNDKFYDASDVRDVYMEVSINVDGAIDLYDYAIEKAVNYQNTKNDDDVSGENAFAGEPFSRYEREFTFVK